MKSSRGVWHLRIGYQRDVEIQIRSREHDCVVRDEFIYARIVLTYLMFLFVCALILKFKLHKRDNFLAQEAVIRANFMNIEFRKLPS